jgi:hypothetical protein
MARLKETVTCIARANDANAIRFTSAPGRLRRVAAFDPALISFRHDEDVAIATVLEEHGPIGDVVGLAVAIKHDAAGLGNFAETIGQLRERQRARSGKAALLVLFCRAHVDQNEFFPGIHQLLDAIGRKIIDGVFYPVPRK